MCIAELNVSTLPCQHRWYHLVHSCSPSTHLGNCPSKLGLEGWEIKCDFCPYCAEWGIDDTTYRLVGTERSGSIGGLHRSPSVALSATRRDSRRGSLARTDSSSSMTMITSAYSERNRAMNARLDSYLMARPEKIMSVERPSNSEGAASLEEEPTSPVTTDRDSGSSIERSDGLKTSVFNVGKSWKKHTKRFSRSFFK